MKNENNMTTHQIDQLLTASVEVEKLNTIINDLKADKTFLSKDNERLVTELKDSDKANSRVEIGRKEDTSHFDYKIDRYVTKSTFTPFVVTNDLEEVKQEMKKIITSDIETNIAKLENNNKNLNNDNEELREEMEDFKKSQFKNYDKKIRLEKERYEERTEKHLKEIKILNSDLLKERDNKTDAELTAKRKEEIKALKVRISDLETEVREVLSLGFWKRQWYKLTHIPALTKAKEVVIERERAADRVSYGQGGFFGLNIW